jgi:hypothetical protein
MRVVSLFALRWAAREPAAQGGIIDDIFRHDYAALAR